MPYPPLGLLYLSSHLKAEGFSVAVHDATFAEAGDFAAAVARLRPVVVGLYATLMTRPAVLEMAAERGKGTGVVSTSQVTHASPAAFVVHVASRRDYPAIADQFADNRINGLPVAQVILGGGVADFRRDDRDVAAELVEEAGYTLVDRGMMSVQEALTGEVFVDREAFRHRGFRRRTRAFGSHPLDEVERD